MGYSSITIKDIPSIIMSSLVLSLIPLFAVIFVLDEIDGSTKNTVLSNKNETTIQNEISASEYPEEENRTSSMSVTDEAAASADAFAKATSTTYNNIARFIAGMPQLYENEFSALESYPSWIKYSASAGKRWEELKKGKFRNIINFRDSELDGVNSKARTVFYPFSGPDFLHAGLFFPNADEFIMIGLEKVGRLPNTVTITNDSLMMGYISTINRSLRDVLSLSFFITKKMKTDFKNSKLEGLLPALMVFIVRTDHVILDIRFFNLNKDGTPAYLAHGFGGQSTGVEIAFKDKNNEFKKLQYLSVNLADSELKSGSPSFAYLGRIQGEKVTYLKAASYLMHNNYFGTIRSFILNSSFAVLQDDSGIPYRFFSSKEWNKKLYGSYNGTIGLFAGRGQKDLSAAYEKAGQTKPLGFGIGYKHRKGSSNLMLAIKELNL